MGDPRGARGAGGVAQDRACEAGGHGTCAGGARRAAREASRRFTFAAEAPQGDAGGETEPGEPAEPREASGEAQVREGGAEKEPGEGGDGLKPHEGAPGAYERAGAATGACELHLRALLHGDVPCGAGPHALQRVRWPWGALGHPARCMRLHFE